MNITAVHAEINRWKDSKMEEWVETGLTGEDPPIEAEVPAIFEVAVRNPENWIDADNIPEDAEVAFVGIDPETGQLMPNDLRL